jgi:glucoamylase
MTTLAPEYQWIEADGSAPGAPGLGPRWTSSEKDAVGTSYATSSRVWFTISHGILNEIYYPTIDRPQVRDLGFLITDGETFFHEVKRDLENTFEYIDQESLAVRVTSRDPEGRYTLVKEIISDPHYPVILVHVRVEGEERLLNRLKAYALLAPHMEGGGAENSGRSVEVSGRQVLLAWRDPTSLAMGVDCDFTRVSCGFVGVSDGWQDLNDNLKMDWEYDQALGGNIALMGEIDLARHKEFTLSVGFGRGHHAAISSMMQALATPFALHLTRFVEQWHRAKSPLDLSAASMDGGRLLLISRSVLLAHEDKTYPGAFIASLSIPWGQVKGDDDLGGYHLVWTRDMVQSATALMACGRMETALRALVYLATTQRPDGSFAQNFWINGTPYWTGMQLDEVAFPIMLAWRLWKAGGLGSFDVFPLVEQAAGFLVRHAPVTQQERWEENAGYSPSTLAAVIAGLICASDMAQAYGAPEMADLLAVFADWLESHLEDWTVTCEGILHPEVQRHYMRIRPPQPGDPYCREDCGADRIRLSNRGPGERYEFEAREIIDHGFLELVRYGIRPPDDPLIVDSLKVVDAVLKIDTPFGPCWRRYNHDGYGQRHDGSPYQGWGQGRAWPLLTGERAHYELAAGRDVRPLVRAYEQFSSQGGMLPEQIWDEADKPSQELYLGRHSGAAMPLAWAHAEYIKLLRSVMDGHVFDSIPAVEERYLRQRPARSVEIFKLDRPLQRIAPGKTLRIVAPTGFRVLWTADNWSTTNTLEAKHAGSPGCFADIAVPQSQQVPVQFTFYWSKEERWENKNYSVAVGPGQE